MAYDFEKRYNKPIVCKVVQPVYPELVQISKVVQEREKLLKKSISQKCDQALQQLKIDYEANLSTRDVNLVLELMNFELNIYQRAELNATITKAQSFKIKSLKDWIFKNRNFILCKVIGPTARTTSLETKLPAIKDRSRLIGRIHTNADYIRLAKKNKEISSKFTKELDELYNANVKIKEDIKGKKVLERLNRSMKEQQRSFVKNVELLSLIKKYSTHMGKL